MNIYFSSFFSNIIIITFIIIIIIIWQMRDFKCFRHHARLLGCSVISHLARDPA